VIKDKDGYDRELEAEDVAEHAAIFRRSFMGVWRDDLKMFYEVYVPRHLPTILDESIERLAHELFNTPLPTWA
jgi:hypothetical protein